MSTFVRSFEALPLLAGAIIIVAGFAIAAVLLARLSQRVFHTETLIEHNDLTGFIFAVVGVIYAVILGFIAISVWERYAGAESAAYVEAGDLTTVYRDAATFSGGAPLQRELRVYVTDIINKEWPAMQAGRSSQGTEAAAESVARDVNMLAPRTLRESNLQAQMIESTAEALASRNRRLAENATGLNGVMWAVVIFGGFLTVAYSFLFGFKATHMQTAMVGALAVIIGLVIFLTMSLDYPYQGNVRVTPDAFERAVGTFASIDRTTHT